MAGADAQLARKIKLYLSEILNRLSTSQNAEETTAVQTFLNAYQNNTFDLAAQNTDDSLVLKNLATAMNVSSFSELSNQIQSEEATGKIMITVGDSGSSIVVGIDGTPWTSEYSPRTQYLDEQMKQIQE